jgi:hypothetical protein
MNPTDCWEQPLLVEERLHEAATQVDRIPGAHGFIGGGSVGPGENR